MESETQTTPRAPATRQSVTDMYECPAPLDESQPDYIRYCLVTSLVTKGNAESEDEVKAFDDAERLCSKQYEDAVSTVHTAMLDTPYRSEFDFRWFLNRISGVVRPWSTVRTTNKKGKTVPIATQRLFTDLLTSEATWVVAICNDGRVWSKTPAQTRLVPMEGTQVTESVVG